MANLPFRNLLSGANRKFSHLTKHAQVITVILVVVLIGVVATLVYMGIKKPSNQTGNVCSDQILQSASNQIGDTKKVKDFEKTVDTIKSTPKFDQDPNCLVIVTTYYVQIGDAGNASTYFAQLQKVYNPKIGFSIKLDLKTINFNSLKDQITFLNQAKSQLRTNSEKLKYGSKRQ